LKKRDRLVSSTTTKEDIKMQESNPATKSHKPRKAFVLLSGGLDSTTCLHKAIVEYSPLSEEETLARIQSNQSSWASASYAEEMDWVEAVSIDYGQRHAKEMDLARRTCEIQSIKYTVLRMSDDALGDKNTMLTNPNIQIPNISYSEIKGVSPTYVPFRNGNLLALVTAHAQKWVNQQVGISSGDIQRAMEDSCGIYFGAHAEDAANWAYPDCTPEFIGAIGNAIYIGTYRAIRLHTPLQWLMKHEIVTLGASLGVDFANTWSCYKGEQLHCGVCPTCRSRRVAFIKTGVQDPTVYAETPTDWNTVRREVEHDFGLDHLGTA
jgi:7-cyano-7-deazaguanine synthase